MGDKSPVGERSQLPDIDTTIPHSARSRPGHGAAVDASMRLWNESGAAPIRHRTRKELIGFFDGLELLEPGVVSCSLWRPDRSEIGIPAEVHQYCGLARKS